MRRDVTLAVLKSKTRKIADNYYPKLKSFEDFLSTYLA